MRLNTKLARQATLELLGMLSERPEGLRTSELIGTPRFHGEKTLKSNQIIRLLRESAKSKNVLAVQAIVHICGGSCYDDSGYQQWFLEGSAAPRGAEMLAITADGVFDCCSKCRQVIAPTEPEVSIDTRLTVQHESGEGGGELLVDQRGVEHFHKGCEPFERIGNEVSRTEPAERTWDK